MSAPPPEGVPAETWAGVEALVATGEGDADALAAELVAWLDGRPVGDLDAVLDALRDRGAYPVSVVLLEHAWNAQLPLDAAGRVAEDWLGTVLHGLGDREGARVVARHLVAGAVERGPAFAGDLGDLLMTMTLFDEARPLVEEAVALHPGDLTHRFNLGVLQKFAGEWAGCRASFETVARLRDDPAALWNLGIACTALRDWPAARAAWRKVGFEMPPGEGDYARPGQATPVRLRAPAGAPVQSEIVWGDRLCPARVRLRNIPRFAAAGFGDVVLIDGVAAGEVRGADGQKATVHAALGVHALYGGRTFALRAVDGGPAHREAAARLAERLAQAGWPAADQTTFAAAAGLRVARVGPPGAEAAAALAAVAELRGPVAWWSPALAEAAGADAAAHRAALEDAGLAP